MSDITIGAPYLSRRSMLRSTGIVGAGLLTALPLGQAAFAQTSTNWPNVEAWMRSFVDQRKVPNMVATLGWNAEAAETIALGVTSFDGGTNVDADSLYRIYSMTKPITGMAVMMCIADGLISLDQPLAEIIPAFADMQVQKTYDGAITADNLEPAVRPITIRHLLTHTAGLSYNAVQQGPIKQALDDAGLIAGYITPLQVPGLNTAPPAESLAVFAERMATMPLVLQPGTKWNYSSGPDILGRVIEIVTGKTFPEFLAERIFGPCGMNSTYFRVPDSEKHRLTTSYFSLNGNLLPVDLPESSVYAVDQPIPFGGSGLVSSPCDYDRFLTMLAGYGEIDGQRVMSEPAVRLGVSNLFPDTLAADGGFSNAGLDLGFGACGLVGTGIAEGLYGWFGAASTVGLVSMKYGLRHNLMTQIMPGELYPIYGEFPEVVLQDATLRIMGGA